MADTGSASLSGNSADRTTASQQSQFFAFAEAEGHKGRLDQSILNSEDPEEQVKIFLEWKGALETDPGSCNIPEFYHDDVKTLIKTFLPSDRILWINFGKDFTEVHAIKVRFCTVRGDPQSAIELSIFDTASALGYIFSVVNPPSCVKNIDRATFLVPMLTLYAQCIGVAYLLLKTKDDHQSPITDPSNDCPVMSCVMFAPPNQDCYFFGSTYKAMRRRAPAQITPRNRLEMSQAIDIVRREIVNKAATNRKVKLPDLSRYDRGKFEKKYDESGNRIATSMFQDCMVQFMQENEQLISKWNSLAEELTRFCCDKHKAAYNWDAKIYDKFRAMPITETLIHNVKDILKQLEKVELSLFEEESEKTNAELKKFVQAIYQIRVYHYKVAKIRPRQLEVFTTREDDSELIEKDPAYDAAQSGA